MRILVWGTGKLAKRYVNLEYFTGHEIVGFVDTFKMNKCFMGYPLYKPQDISRLEYDFLFVCVLRNNGEILENCMSEGIQLSKVLFVGQGSRFDDVENKYLKQLLRKEDIRHSFPALYRDIEERQPQDKKCDDTSALEFRDGAFIYLLGESHIVAWIPVELLFSQRQEDNYLETYTKEWILENRKYENIPVISLVPHRSLFSFFMNGSEYPAAYCEWFQKIYTSRGMDSGYTDEQIIEQRLCEFRKMQYELNRGMDFFLAHPAIGKWNERGYFNLMDGHHRVCFLYYAGLTRIPVQVSQRDYQIWCNPKCANSVYQMVLKQRGREFWPPVLNPYFLNLPFYKENYSKSKLHHIMEFFGSASFKGKRVLEVGEGIPIGYVGRYFCRMGAEVTMLEPDGVLCNLMKKVNHLMHISCETVVQKFGEYKPDKEYDIAVLLQIFCRYVSNDNIRKKFLRHISELVTQMIIWESGDCPDREKYFIQTYTKFHTYHRLSYTYETGKFRELGIFTANDSEYFTEI